jgi:hypothetical protein
MSKGERDIFPFNLSFFPVFELDFLIFARGLLFFENYIGTIWLR